MDSKILYEKDGMKFTKLENKKYCLDFSMENKNINMANIVDFSLIKLVYDLNGDIYESVDLQKLSENQSTVTLLMKHLFEDLGLPQSYSYLHMTKTMDNNQIIFRSQTIHSEIPPGIPNDAKLMAMKENIGICELVTPDKVDFSFTVLFEDYVEIPIFAEKMIGLILNKIFKRVKQFIENFRYN
jgi:hypothetical protein